jgi:ParB family chromosome partitioning protein
VQASLGDGSISAGHARALLPLGDEREQVAFCRKIQDEGLSVRDTEQQVREKIEALDAANPTAPGASAKKRRRKPQSDQIAALERELRLALGTKTEIRSGSRGRGRIVVHFGSHDEFERIRALLIESGGLDIAPRIG